MKHGHQPTENVKTFPPGTYDWVVKVIQSCKTLSQCQSCENLIDIYLRGSGDSLKSKLMLTTELNKHKHTIHV